MVMGTCLCIEKNEVDERRPSHVTISNIPNASHTLTDTTLQPTTAFRKGVSTYHIEILVMDTLGIIPTLVDNEQEPPNSMLVLHNIADNEEGWTEVVLAMIKVIPLTDPLGPSVITLLIDEFPLPSKDSVLNVVKLLNLSKESAMIGRKNPTRERNICVVLGCIAETLVGPRNMDIFNEDSIHYLLTNLSTDTDPNVILFSLIALEKLAQTMQNKTTIMKILESQRPCPLSTLESWRTENNFVKRQVGFCAQWILDNLFVFKNRTYSYQSVNMERINAMLNTKDVSENLKISPDGLEARCDAYSFESVRCTAHAQSGIWYYEVLIITPGVMQIGWATKNSTFLNHEGFGIGDDEYSIAFDGCRKLIWYNAQSSTQVMPKWESGDIVGCLLDLESQQIYFYVNGTALPPCTSVFSMATTGFFAAASFMSFQQCRFNFGAEPFKYPPKMNYSTFNDHGILSPSDKIVLPRHILLSQLRQQKIGDDSCTLCYDQQASVRLIPCDHSGFCRTCVSHLEECPMCRSHIERTVDTP